MSEERVHETLSVVVEVRKIDEHGPISNCDDDTKMWVSFNPVEKAVTIEGNRAGLNSLARHLLTLTQDSARGGYNLSWEAESGWFASDEAGLHLMLAE